MSRFAMEVAMPRPIEPSPIIPTFIASTEVMSRLHFRVPYAPDHFRSYSAAFSGVRDSAAIRDAGVSCYSAKAEKTLSVLFGSGKRKMLLGAVADDLTGATDLALMISRQGMKTVQAIGALPQGDDFGDADAVVVALKSRTIPAADAVKMSLAAASALRA